MVSKRFDGAAELVIGSVGPAVLGVLGHLADRKSGEAKELRAVELAENVPNGAGSLAVAEATEGVERGGATRKRVTPL